MSERDLHHPLHDRKAWEARVDGQILRRKLLAPRMARTAHNLLHANTSPVPVPLYPTLNWLSFRFDPTGDVFTDIDGFTSLLDRANERRPSEIEQGVNSLCINALRSQIPFLRDGMPSHKTVIDLGESYG